MFISYDIEWQKQNQVFPGNLRGCSSQQKVFDKYSCNTTIYYMIPGPKGLNPHELAHKWIKDLGSRPDMNIKVGC